MIELQENIKNPIQSTVDEKLFVSEMVKAWNDMGNISSNSLELAWKQLVKTFNKHITNEIKNRWSVLPMPTGTGKTTGLEIYCTLLKTGISHPGVLIVTELKESANNLTQKINQRAGNTIADTYHADNEIDTRECQETPILIITHQAFKNVLNAEANNVPEKSKKNKFFKWQLGTRKLIVVDEILNIAENISLRPEDIMFVRSRISKKLFGKFRNEIAVLDKVIIKLLTKIYDKDDIDNFIKAEDWQINIQYDFTNLLLELIKLDLDNKAEYEKVLNGLQYILSNWSRFLHIKEGYKLTSTAIILPFEFASSVILDATAIPNRIYDLLGSIPDYVEIPQDIRHYCNVTLNIYWRKGLGKTALKKQNARYFKKVIDELSKNIGKDNKVLFCTHKDVEHNFKDLGNKYKATDTMHWGAIAGKNDWNDYDSLVIYGVQLLPVHVPEDILRAFLKWHENTDGKHEKAIPYYYNDETIAA